MSSAQAERNLGQGDIDLAACEAKRKLLADSWPVDAPMPANP